MPSTVRRWQHRSTSGADLDWVRALTPESSLIDRVLPLPPCLRWPDWTDRCSPSESVVPDATLRSKQAKRVDVTDKAQ